jgi:hypothetical protein
MSAARLALPFVLTLCACVPDSGPAEPYAFVGSWDCGVQTFSFTNTTYDDGTGTYRILDVRRTDQSYRLRFANGSMIALAAVTSTGLTWVSGTTGDQFNCVRVN